MAYQFQLDGYRALAIKTAGKVRLVSRNDNDFSGRYPVIVRALQKLPDETVIDGKWSHSMTRAVPRSMRSRTTAQQRTSEAVIAARTP